MQRNRKGFTITELVIVIAVVAILAAVLIPTFVSLIRKANASADIQLVRQMNTILKTDEAVNGIPANIEGVKDVLAADGITNPTPAMEDHVFAWDKEANVIVLVDKTTNKGVFPKEYEGVEYKATWELLAGTVSVSMEDLGATLEEALAKATLGQTIVMTSNQTLNATESIKNANIDMGGYKLTLANGLPMEANGSITLSNGDVETAHQITIANGANLTLEDVDFVSSSHRAFFPTTAAQLEIIGGSIIAEVPIDTNYSDNTSRAVIVNMRGTTLGSAEKPCKIGLSLITSGDVTITDSTIYAYDRCVYNRAGNVTIKNSTMEYMPTVAYNATYLPVTTNSYAYTPNGARNYAWGSSYDGNSAPIVVGDFYAQHYSIDANCTLVNVTVKKDSDIAKTYPDVYLSQENYDVVPVAGSVVDATKLSHDNLKGHVKEVVKTNLTCDSSISWAVNPGDNSAFVSAATGDKAIFADYEGFQFSNSMYGGVALLYVDNVFVNGVEQAKGSTSASPVPAN